MRIERAIEILDPEHREHYESIEPVKEACRMGMKALEKQIPKKPLDICTPVVTWGICPVCKGELNKLGNSPNRVFKSNAYCMDCGQKLDWSDT